MKHLADPAQADFEPASIMPLMNEGDEAWARKSSPWRERELALPWPKELLRAFSHRMASHGMCVSQTMMLCDRRYALQQLVHAHNMTDETLRSMAVKLFHFSDGRLVSRNQSFH